MTAQLAPTPIFKGWDSNGVPLANGKLFSYIAGTTVKQATYTDYTQTTPNTNPVILNARGEAAVWIDPALTYKLVLAPSTDTDPPTSPIWTVDQIGSALVTSSVISAGGINVTGSVMPQNGWYEPSPGTLAGSSNGAQRVTVNTTGNWAFNQPVSGPTLTVYESLDGINAQKTVATYDQGTFIGTLSGCTTFPTATFNWSRSGNQVTIDCAVTLTATSNSTSCSIIGVPTALNPLRVLNAAGMPQIFDNSVVGFGFAQVGATPGTIILARGVTSTVLVSNVVFTASGTKGISGMCITYPLT